MEQRIQNLEEEVKLLKNQIRTVLLDIKESLSSGEWQTTPGKVKAEEKLEESEQSEGGEGEKAKGADSEAGTLSTGEVDSVKEGREGEEEGSGIMAAESISRTRAVRVEEGTIERGLKIVSGKNGNGKHQSEERREGQAKVREEGGGGSLSLEPLKLVLLLEWIERSEAALGKEGTESLLEIYTAGMEIPETTKQALKLIMGYRGKGKKARTLATALPYLVELDGLFRDRVDENHSLQNLALKMISSRLPEESDIIK